MSRILRNIVETPVVQVGEKHLDFEKEKNAQSRLKDLFPIVTVTTDADGAKFIPVQNVFAIEKIFMEEKTKSHEEGYKLGFDAGLNKGLEKAEKVLKDFDLAIKNAITHRESLFEEAREEILELIVKISKKVTFDAIEIDREKTTKIIQGVISSLVDRSKIKIKVNPQHLPLVEQDIDRFLKESTVIKELSIEADPRVQYGGCFIETPTGDIDARIESQFDVINDLLVSNGEEI